MKKTKATTPIRPFLKWAGNKYRLIERIVAALPESKRLVEPFVGSGALFLNSDYKRYLLCDANPDLITLYQLLKEQGDDFIAACRPLFCEENNRAEAYYALRDEFNASDDPLRRSVLFVYLNRYGYNGLCRYNSKGGFNVPFGRYKRPYFPAEEMLAFHHKARYALFRHQDFATTLAKAKAGDVIYCDPPYVPLSDSANFTAYSAGGFTMEQQQQLVTLARAAAMRGIPVLISNHDTRHIRKIYHDATVSRFQVQRSISCDGKHRGSAGEVLALFSAK
ncbi:MAG TPA: Dam family site-specific DNA-(adenine-N6)-methyltransferase [Gammaproteobacteria bacterium]